MSAAKASPATEDSLTADAIAWLRSRLTQARDLLKRKCANEALLPLRDILAEYPDYPDALNLASVAFGQLKMLEEAEDYSRRAIALRPDNASFHLNLANRLNDRGRHDEAIRVYEKALGLAPGDGAIARSYLGCLAGARRWLEARALVDRLLPHVERDPALLVQCAEICLAAEDRRRALDLYQQALESDPVRREWLLQLARIAINLDEMQLAKSTGERAIEIEDHAEMRSMLAAIAHRTGDFKTMVRHLEAIPEGSDQAANSANLLGMMLMGQARTSEGLKSMARNEEMARDAFPLQATRLMYLNYDPAIEREELLAAHQEIGERFATALPTMDQSSFDRSDDPDRRLRIGIVSPDLRAHSVAYFIRPFLGAFDRDRFDVIAYASVAKEDMVSQDLKHLVTKWRNVFDLGDQRLADRIRDDGIDILIDLAGLTRDTRILAFTARPAPIQMTYVGYPSTTGLPAIDYRITDWIADPEGADVDYAETLIRLPGCFLSYAVPSHAPPLEPGPCEHRDHVTFGSFNNFAKINDDVLALWADVLSAEERSQLLLKSTTSGDPEAQNVIRRKLATHGVDPARIRFSAFRETPQSHLAVYNDVDIALDTFPYNGTTTTCEALWMGVPIVTLRGDRHAGRVGASLLRTIGFDAGIAKSRDDYVLTARLLAENPGLLKTARRTLRDTVARSALCDHAAHTRSLEDAFRAVWRIWCEEGREAPRALKAAP